jgi:mevalonate kinase
VKLNISLPSKTFFVGEYLALKGGPVLTVNTRPRFQMKIGGTDQKNKIHPESPAGKLLEAHSEFFKNINIEFLDPHLGKGGFGASSAQFAMLYALRHIDTHFRFDVQRFYDWKMLLSDYQNLSLKTRYLPSGADLIGQVCGGITFFNRSEGKLQNFAWPFSDIGFYILRTGFKVATHEHLSELSEFETANFDQASRRVLMGFSQIRSQDVVDGVNQYQNELQKQNKTFDGTLKKLEILRKAKGVLAAKGCGALGADALLVVAEKNSDLQAVFQNQDLQLIATENEISKGIKIQTEEQKTLFERTI